jgi:large subunit ribosomal protein L4
MQVDVYNILGEKIEKKIELNSSIFGIEPHNHSIYLDIKHILANKRQGTHKTKEKSDLSGSTRKILKQKGSGGARKGSIKSPLFVGGARIFGPVPRSYEFKLNKKVKVLARKSVLSLKTKSNNIYFLDNFEGFSFKTKSYIEFLKKFNVYDKKTLIYSSSLNENLILSSRNIQNTKVLSTSFLNTYDLLNANYVFFDINSLSILEKNLL